MTWLRGLAVGAWFGIAACGGPTEAPDASLPDGGIDAGPRCTTAADCDDGLVCNGAETCTPNGCAASTTMRCDDGVACTIDACSEALASCVHRVPDVDGDGVGDARCVDVTGTALGIDCDDTDPARFGGNTELCDAAHVDEDCIATTLGRRDDDNDGFVSSLCCDGATCGDDCDDTRPSVHVGATEVCNGLDDDCDGHVDEAVSVAGFVDADHDGWGDGAMPRTACGTAVGFSVYGTDCDDTNAAVHPGQPELCDGIDNDCDTATAIDAGAAPVTWYRDADGDGFGTASATTTSCAPPTGYVILGTDCDDTSVARSPASPELCNGVDDDCSGTADYVIASGDLEDDDRDGVPDAACADPRARDCDDHDPTSGPGAIETCDGRDNDCDTRIDEGATAVVYYRDADGDGFGASGSARAGCVAPAGFSARGGDCDDASNARFPGALEPCNAIDDDCDVAVDEGRYASESCSLAHAASVCVVGTCRVVSCDTGYDDCSSGPGCETSTLSDAAHCGDCATHCAGSCVNGACVPECMVGASCAATNVCAWGTCGAGNTCGAGSVVDCGPVRIDPRTASSTTRVGTPSGSAFIDACPASQVATGLQAKIDDADGHLFGVSLLCAEASIVSGTVTMTSPTVQPGPGRGTGSSAAAGPSLSVCPDGAALSGADVRVSAGAIVGLRAHCRPLGFSGTAAVGDFALTIGAATNASALGDITGATTTDCAAGQTSTGMSLTASLGVTSLSLACGPSSLVVQTSPPPNGNPTFRVDDCPAGQVPISLGGDSTLSSFYDDTLMEIRFGCGFLDVTSDGHGGWTTSVRASGGALLPSSGGLGCCYSSHQPFATTTCPADQVIVGTSGVHGNFGPNQVTLYCAPVLVTGDATSGFVVRYGTASPQAPVGSGGGLPPVAVPLALCPQGTIGLGWGSSNGEVMSGLALRCAPPLISPL